MTKEKTIKRILIANRGEIAVRVIRACKDLGIESVAIYSDADATSMHVRMADFAYCLGGTSSAESYLHLAKIKKAIETSKCDAVHPGYGFLSESIPFRKMISKLKGVRFIGPSLSAMEQMGDKVEARKLMTENHVPMVPGLARGLESVEDLGEVSKKLGFPLILKAAAGGGGRGMRIVREDSELKDAFEACKREALDYFGNPEVFCERFIENPRHIEFQVLFDEQGNGVHLFERDCSVQRRHQKLFEEAPSAYLSPEDRKRLGEIAVKAGKACGYSGAGTVEFICDSPKDAFFMEMNTRIQVEHPVTEQITGIDLIREQILVAMGEPLAYKQEDIVLRGWALEARINAEDPTQGFLPAPGTISRLRLPQGPGVRVDTHLYEGYTIPTSYDSMVAKLIVTGRDRSQAFAAMRRALSECEIAGISTTISFHQALLENPVFVEGSFTTRFLEEQTSYFENYYEANDISEVNFLIAALLKATDSSESSPPSSPDDRSRWSQRNRHEATTSR